MKWSTKEIFTTSLIINEPLQEHTKLELEQNLLANGSCTRTECPKDLQVYRWKMLRHFCNAFFIQGHRQTEALASVIFFRVFLVAYSHHKHPKRLRERLDHGLCITQIRFFFSMDIASDNHQTGYGHVIHNQFIEVLYSPSKSPFCS